MKKIEMSDLENKINSAIRILRIAEQQSENIMSLLKLRIRAAKIQMFCCN